MIKNNNKKNLIFAKNLFSGKKILVTGATSGIGKNTALMLNKLGAKLILIGRDNDKLNEVKNDLGNSHSYFCCDLSEEDKILDVFNNLSNNFLPIDGVFHSSGNIVIKSLKITRTKDLYKMISTTASVAICLGKAAMNSKFFKENSSILFMSSVSSICGNEGLSAYAASKGAIDSLVKTMSVELSKRKIRINSLVAGAVETPLHKNLIKNLSNEGIENYRKKHLLGFGTETDITDLAIFILSDGSRWITGSNLIIDGGYSAI